MQTEPILIDGIAGPVAVTTGQFGGVANVLVDGRPAPAKGSRRYDLPSSAGGTVEASARVGFADPYPTLTVNGVKHRTGPQAPVLLKVLSVLPIALVLVGGLLGGLVGLIAFVVNQALIRLSLRPAARVLAVVGVDIAAVIVFIVLAAAVQSAIN